MTSLTSSENDKMQAYLDASRAIEGSLGSEQERHMRDRRLMESTEKALEEKYADRGLKFTSGFRGGMPMQAFGVIDGMRFYFRFRHDAVGLRIGEMDPELPQKNFERQIARRDLTLSQIDAEVRAGTLSKEDAERDRRWANASTRRGPEVPNGIMDYPTIVHFSSVLSDFLGQDYAGVLDHDEAFNAFVQAMDELRPAQ